MKRPPLHRLRNGIWVDLANAYRIEAQSRDEYHPRPKVNISGPFGVVFVEFLTLKSAQAYADELADIRNSYDLDL